MKRVERKPTGKETYSTGSYTEKNMRKKIMTVATMFSLCLIVLAPFAIGDTTIMGGTFDPTTSLSASLVNATMDWESLSISGNETELNLIVNDGDVVIDTSLNMSGDTADLSYVQTAGGAAPTGEDQFTMWYDANATDTAVSGGGSTAYAFLTNTSATLMGDINASEAASFKISLLATTAQWSLDHGEQTVGITVTYVENS